MVGSALKEGAMTSLRDVAASCRDTIYYFLNWKTGGVSAFFYGALAAWINWRHGIAAGLAAGFLQGGIAFFLTGFTAGVAQRISDMLDRPVPAYLFGSTVPALITFVFSAVGHWYRATPELWATVFSAMAVSFGTSMVMNALVRNYELLPYRLQRLIRFLVMKNSKIT